MTGSGAEPLKPSLGKPGVGEIHLWCLPADAESRAEFLSGGSETLSAEERGRHAAITHPGAAGRFLAGRILARRVLGRYLSQTPETIPLLVDAAGKPSLGDGVRSGPAFSLSHAGSETVLAVAGEGDVGVDIEAHSRAPAVLRIAREFYSPAECQLLDSQDGDAADCALTLWTLKESIVKARGHTVWDGLSGVSLSIDGADIVWESPPPEGNHWRLAAGTFRESYKLAIAQTLAGANAALPSIITFEVLATGEPVGVRFEPSLRG